jgi:ribosome-binding factor A
MPKDTRRADRVAEAIREEVASYLATGVRDPRITGLVTVTGVDMTSDLRHARVYVSVLTGDDDRPAVDTTLEALNDIGRRLKGEVGRALRLRLAPELEFRLDETVARASRIESLLAQLKNDDDRRDD